jgi:23S rRNA pseudouridine1911/1915/1917 synthase
MNHTLDVLYEDNHLLIVNKPCGILVQADKQKTEENLENIAKHYVKDKYQKPGEVFIGIPHRIDRPTSGIVILCRTSKALERINEMFQKKEIKKVYWAVVKNKPPKDAANLIHWLRKDEKANRTFAYPTEQNNTLKAEMNYQLIKSSDLYHLLEVEIITGRHHQIRAQLSKINCPIRGDVKYGFERTNRDGGIDLHARKIEFLHPVTKELVSVEAPIRDNTLWKALISNESK